MNDLEAFGIAVAGIARDLQDENAALRAKVATLEAQLAAVTPWEIVGRVPTEEERSCAAVWAVLLPGGRIVEAHWHDWWAMSPSWLAGAGRSQKWLPFGPDGRPMPKPAHIP